MVTTATKPRAATVRTVRGLGPTYESMYPCLFPSVGRYGARLGLGWWGGGVVSGVSYCGRYVEVGGPYDHQTARRYCLNGRRARSDL